MLEFFRPSIEANASLHEARVFLNFLIERLLDEGHEDDALWLIEHLLRVRTNVVRKTNFQFEYLKLRGEETSGVSEYVLSYDLRFMDEMANFGIRQIYDKILKVRIERLGAKFLHRITWLFIEARATAARGAKSNLSTDYIRSAIEIHAQDTYRNDPINTILNILRDCWEELAAINPKVATGIYEGWSAQEDELLLRLSIHALRFLVEIDVIG